MLEVKILVVKIVISGIFTKFSSDVFGVLPKPNFQSLFFFFLFYNTAKK